MAALTPSATRKIGGFGDADLIIATFSTADDADTWASGLPNVIKAWTNDNTNPATQTSVGVAFTESSGTFTFYPAEDGVAFDLFVITQT